MQQSVDYFQDASSAAVGELLSLDYTGASAPLASLELTALVESAPQNIPQTEHSRTVLLLGPRTVGGF